MDSAKEKLYRLLNDFDSCEDYDIFRISWEKIFNFELSREEVSDVEFEAFEEIFNLVVWYSPITGDHKKYPGYKNENDVKLIVNRAKRKLGLIQ